MNPWEAWAESAGEEGVLFPSKKKHAWKKCKREREEGFLQVWQWKDERQGPVSPMQEILSRDRQSVSLPEGKAVGKGSAVCVCVQSKVDGGEERRGEGRMPSPCLTDRFLLLFSLSLPLL